MRVREAHRQYDDRGTLRVEGVRETILVSGAPAASGPGAAPAASGSVGGLWDRMSTALAFLLFPHLVFLVAAALASWAHGHWPANSVLAGFLAYVLTWFAVGFILG